MISALGKFTVEPQLLRNKSTGRVGNIVYSIKYLKNNQIIPFTLFRLRDLGHIIDLITERPENFGLKDFERP